MPRRDDDIGVHVGAVFVNFHGINSFLFGMRADDIRPYM